MSFNFFNVLNKDDKEVIHSAFIKYLLDNFGDFFYSKLFNLDFSDFNKAQLEKSYDKKRFDIQIISNDESKIIVIENKFKSFPLKEQLVNYDNLLVKHHKDKVQFKYLLSFDPKLISFSTNNWKVISYNKILNSIESFLATVTDLTNDHKIFIQHYYESLAKYCSEYKMKLSNMTLVFKDKIDNEDKFWLRLILFAIRNKLQRAFNELDIKVKFVVNPGNTSVPLLNIIPIHWFNNGAEHLIQFQGTEIKFYIHSTNKDEIISLIKYSKKVVNSDRFAFKKITKRKERSSYIFKENITKIIVNNISLDYLISYLLNFYKIADEVLTKYNTD